VTKLSCLLAEVNKGILPVDLAGRLPNEIAARYQSGSGGAIELSISRSGVPPVFQDNQAVSAYYLHSQLSAVTGDKVDPPTIAVLYASSYAISTPGVLGVMFDRGFTTGDDPNPVHEPSRLGCAVFLNTIREVRGAGAAFGEEAVFTTLHELGHTFNLWHVEDGQNIMTISQPDGVIAENFWVFEEAQRDWLAKCDQDKSVMPGGSPYQGDEATSFNAPDWLSRPLSPFGAAFEIDVRPREFWHFEPVHLDLGLRAVGIPPRALTIPDEIDPGHKRLRILIEDASGQRRLYRSPLIFCAAHRTRTITREPFRRDLPLFGQAGGYTFLRSGKHRIQAELGLPDGSTLTSNVVEVHVKADRPRDSEWRAAAHLRRDRIAKVLFHKTDLRDAQGIRLLETWLNDQPSGNLGSLGIAHYSWAVAVLRHTPRGDKSAPVSLRQAALERLRRAEQHAEIGNHRRVRIAELLEMHGSPRSGPSSSKIGRHTKPRGKNIRRTVGRRSHT